MQLNITARHLNLTPALSEYVHKKVERTERYCDSIIWPQVILSVEKHRQIAEIIVHTPGNTFRTQGESLDLYSAIDLAVHKLELHLAKLKEKRKNHRAKIDDKKIQNLTLDETARSDNAMKESTPVIEIKKIPLKTLSLEQAIRTLRTESLALVPFINERSNKINVLYKKGKSNFGLIEIIE
ncbi:MAG: ribosomal subunit interface protein [Elusimicrobia bacterium GWA2_38_7]|nr:MAG: ribosomal subunit interface protein [Elusimicrobia bacterium GWA2_38_7]